MNWDAYEGWELPLVETWPDLSVKEARRAFDRLMAAKQERISQLRAVLAANAVELGTSDESIQRLNEWLVAAVEPDPSQPGHPTPTWKSLGQDIALFIGEVLIERVPGLEWRLFEGSRRHLSHHHPVVMGFDVINSRFNVDPFWIVGGFMLDASLGRAHDEPDLFVRVLRYHERLGASE